MTPERLIPFPISEATLGNGLRVVVVSTGFPNIVSLQIAVQTGSRNEVEPGKSGFAHFFEHMMFRGTERFPPDTYAATIAAAGARQNAYTTDDFTNYHITCAAEDLDSILEIEADRFQYLRYPEEGFRTESRAILGEYNKGASDPLTKLFEVQRENAFTTHTYKHTTMGFLADIEDMPNQFDYSLEFFRRWYRPQFTTVLVAGDIEPEATIALVEKHFGGWAPGDLSVPPIPQEPPSNGAVAVHVPWSSDALPWVTVAFHAPAFDPADPAYAALDMLLDLWFGETSDLHRRLVETDRVVDLLAAHVPTAKDPPLATVLARVKDPADAVLVRDAILETFARARTEPIASGRLEDAKAYARYSLLRTFDNSEAVASTLIRFAHLGQGGASAIESLFAQYQGLTPQSLVQTAQQYVIDDGVVQATLAAVPLASELNSVPPLASFAPEGTGERRPPAVTRQTLSSQLIFKIQFATGSADDPPGREGLAQLAASMICEAGSTEMRFDEITRALFPIAGSFTALVDRETTTFSGTIHADNFDRFADIVLPQLLTPGFRGGNFDRLRAQQMNALVQDLRASNDEEFAKEVLQLSAFAGGPYGHPTVGTASGLAAVTLGEVRDFIAERYCWEGLTLGLSGNFPPQAVSRLNRALARLPGGRATSPRGVEAHRPDGLEVCIVEKDTRSVAISLGHPIGVLRHHPSYPALWLARAALGDHRAFNGRLFQRIREVRGMNYGDYAYIEAFPGGMYRQMPQPGRPRRAQLFEVWIRPVVPEQAVFALKLALYEVDRFVREGLSEEEFERTKAYLLKNVFVMLQSQDTQLGFDMDGRWFGTGEFAGWMRPALAALTREAVNRAIKDHISADNLFIAMVAGDAQALRAALLSPEPAQITYESPRDEALLAEDRVVGARDLGLTPERIRIVPASEVFA